MSILIKYMEMPDSCHECVAGYGGYCYVCPAEEDGCCPDHGRPDWCPLVEVMDYPQVDGITPSVIKNKTNADCIRAMADDELAKVLVGYCGGCPKGSWDSGECKFAELQAEDKCITCWLEWLKQPYNEKGENT